MFRRVTTKRVLATLLILLAASVVAIKLINHRDAARTEQEQYGVYSDYLFSIPALEKPLPTECREDQRYTEVKELRIFGNTSSRTKPSQDFPGHLFCGMFLKNDERHDGCRHQFLAVLPFGIFLRRH